MVFSFRTVSFYQNLTVGQAHMRILPHNTDFSANLVQPVFLLLPPALLALPQLRYVELLAGVYGAGAHIDNFVHPTERATSQSPFTDIDGELPRSEGLTIPAAKSTLSLIS